MLQLGFQMMSFDKTKPMQNELLKNTFRNLIIAKTVAQE
jgi:hypothetical protein